MTVRTSGPGLREFTPEVVRFVRQGGVGEGLLTLFVRHVSCSPCIRENAYPDARRDLEEFFRRLVPARSWRTSCLEGGMSPVQSPRERPSGSSSTEPGRPK